jgi:probable selenium-dependent hydroxylase accessory protein YqeC
MYPPRPELHRYDRYFSGGEGAGGIPGGLTPAGITLAGLLNKNTGKLEALPPDLLERIVSGYDLALLEGDGSQGLPLKGWADHEPVAPLFTTLTVGVIPAAPLGKKVSGDIIFRLPQFIRLSGAKEGDTITPAHLAAVISGAGPGGGRSLFSVPRGRKLLFINQVEDEARGEQAREVAARLPGEFLSGLEGIIAGSVKEDRAEVLYPP